MQRRPAERHSTRRPGTRTAGRALAIAAIATICLLALEGLVRLLHLAPPVDAQLAEFTREGALPFRRRPHSQMSGRSPTGEFDYDYRHNSEGFRDVEHDLDKPPGVYRIVMLGDSFTYGIGAPFEDTYPRRLERLLNERTLGRETDAEALPGRRVEVVNLALPRYFPAIERIVLEHVGLRYQPDLVVLGLLPNDVIDTYLGVEAILVDDSGFLVSRRAERLGSLAPWLYLRSHVLRIALRRIADLLPAERSPHPADIYRGDGFHEPDWKTIESELDGMRRLALEHGAAFAIVSIPQTGYGKPERSYPDARLGRWSAEHDALFVPARESLLAAGPEETLYWQRDGHCRSEGHEVIAHALKDALLRSRRLP